MLLFPKTKLPGVGLGENEPMFISWSANPMSSSMVTTQISNIFNNGIGRSFDVRMNPTVVRKYTTTIVHSNESANKQELADHHCHSLSKAEKSYYKVEKQ